MYTPFLFQSTRKQKLVKAGIFEIELDNEKEAYYKIRMKENEYGNDG